MDEIYGGNSQGEPPALVKPLSAGILCAAQSDGHWFRCQIVEVMDDDSEEIALLDLDYGGYYTVATSTCRQIRADLLNYPFQAAEARLANIMPINGMTYQTEALPAVEEMLMGTVLTATVVGFHAIDMRPCVELQLDQGDGTLINLNREMCARGLARWIE